jgi:hypothetical protein
MCELDGKAVCPMSGVGYLGLQIFKEAVSTNKLHGVEANSHSADQEVARLLWNPKIYYRVGPYPDPGEFSPHRNTLSKIQPNIILPSTPMSSKYSLSFRFSRLKPSTRFSRPNACYILHPSYPP